MLVTFLCLKDTDPDIVPAIPPILFTRFAIIPSLDMRRYWT